MGGILGGSNKTTVTVPQFLEDAARQNLARADQISQIGYTPYYGPEVAAMTPNQIAAMQNTASGANAFGLAAPSDVMAGMPQVQDFGGVQGYSSGAMYDQALRELQARAPGQYQAIANMFINPQTGAQPMAPFGRGQPVGGLGGLGGMGGMTDRGGASDMNNFGADVPGFAPSGGNAGGFSLGFGGFGGLGDVMGLGSLGRGNSWS
jgi:hypothetical protein